MISLVIQFNIDKDNKTFHFLQFVHIKVSSGNY